jgi:hypothetical protein
MMALDVARELNVSPWEALLKGVRLAAGRVAWVDAQLDRAVRDATEDENDGGSADTVTVNRWLTESRKERALMTRTAAAAINAGVAERMVRQVELEGQVVAEVIGRVIDKLELAPAQRVAAFEEAHRQLLVLEAPSGAPVEVQGSWNPVDDGNPGSSNTEGQGESE